MSTYLNANSGASGQSVTQSATILVITLSQVTVASQNGMWNAELSAFVAPFDGVYRVTGSSTFTNGNNVGDGVIMGFSVNQQGPWPPAAPDLSTTNVIVIEPGYFLEPPWFYGQRFHCTGHRAGDGTTPAHENGPAVFLRGHV